MNIVNNSKKYGTFFVIALSSFALLTSCIKDFEEVNTNKLLPTEEDRGKDGLASGGLLPVFMQKIVPVAPESTGEANEYQVTVDMTGNNWMGYFSPGNYSWDGGTSTPNYFIGRGRLNGIFSSMNRISADFLAIKAATHTIEIDANNKITYQPKEMVDQAIFSVAQIVKIMGYHRTTDMFGPIPYSKIEPGLTAVAYDSQEDIYKSFLNELEEAVNTLNNYKNASGGKVVPDYDPLYQGDVAKWMKLGNSLMLRLAIRIRYADPNLAQEYVTKATTHTGGLLADKNDTAKLVTNGRYRYQNSLYTLWNTYNEGKMGATIYSYLLGYNDPRTEKYFSKSTYNNTEGFYAIRLGIRVPGYVANPIFSNPNIPISAPTYWMKSSEVQFLLAEAALYGLISGSAKEYYEKGVALSFEENDLATSQATNYLASSATPADYTDVLNSTYSLQAISTIDRKWDDNATEEENLERIITQKYIAIHPDGLEAWSEWRRTGYPRIFKEVENLSNVLATSVNNKGTDGGMRRIPYPQDEQEKNTQNVNDARALLGGPDNAATNVWWDKKVKN